MSKTRWKRNEIKNITSLRYDESNINFNGNIFLPYFIEDENKMFDPSKTNIFKKIFFPKLKVKNHPSMEDPFKHKI